MKTVCIRCALTGAQLVAEVAEESGATIQRYKLVNFQPARPSFEGLFWPASMTWPAELDNLPAL